MISTESGIPLKRPANHGQSKYPLNTMEVNDSFLVRVCHPTNRKKFQSAVLRAAWNIRETGKRFTSRQVENGVRVWRVE
jgi:hypothetical protein